MKVSKKKICLVVLFLLLIYAPLVGQLMGVGKTRIHDFTKREKRMPYAYPKRPATVLEIMRFPESFENAFNDHLSFRRLLIKIYGKLSIKVLGVSPHKQLLLGQNGRCYLASHGDGDNDLVFDALTMEVQQQKALADDLLQKEAFLQDLNVPTLILAIPTSPLLEFRYLPRFVQKQIPPPFLKIPPPQRIINRLPEAFSEKHLLFPYQEAREANRAYPLIPEKNFHWRASRYTKLVASCVAERFGIAPFEKPGFAEFERHKTVSDLSHFAGIRLINRNDVLYKNNIWKQLGIREILNPSAVYRSFPEGITFCDYTVNQTRKGKMLLVGNSFVPMLRADLARYFGEVLSINFVNARKDPKIREWFQFVFTEFKPDYIVFCSHNKFHVYEQFIENYYAVQGGLKEHVSSP